MSRRPTPDDLAAIAWLEDHHERDLTPWEMTFLESVAERTVWTDKQATVFDAIWERVVVRP